MHGRLCVSVPGAMPRSCSNQRCAGGGSAPGAAPPDALGKSRARRLRWGVALLALLGSGGTTGCEAIWGSLSVPAAENCVLNKNLCPASQVCNAVTQLCQDDVTLLQATPAHGRTSEETPLTITGTNFVPGMVVRWNGVELQPVKVDSATQLRVTAPISADGGWRVKLEVSTPKGATGSRSDLFSYYATNVTFQPSLPTGVTINNLFILRIIPAVGSGRATVAFADTSSRLRGVTISDDGKTDTDQWMLSTPNPSALLVGDLNGDGRRDLVMTAASGFFWQVGNADSTLQQYQSLHSGPNAGAALGLGDLEADGSADLVGAGPVNNQLAVLRNHGTQYMTFSPTGAPAIQNVAVAELDGQPGDDIAVSYSGTMSSFGVIHGGTTLSSYPDVNIAPCTNGFLQAGRFGAASQSLVLTCEDRVQILHATGGGAFTPGLSWPVNPMTQRVVGGNALLGDFDGNGNLDVLVLRTPTGLPTELWLLENVDGRGTLMARQLAGGVTVSNSSLIDVGDVNDDGKPDVIIGDRLGNSTIPLTVLLNQSR